MLILRWCWHEAASRYYAAMLARGCPYPDVGEAWIYHLGRAADLSERISP